MKFNIKKNHTKILGENDKHIKFRKISEGIYSGNGTEIRHGCQDSKLASVIFKIWV